MRPTATLLKRPRYSDGVDWIALNDESGSSEALSVDIVSCYISTYLLADLYGADRYEVAIDIVEARKRRDKRKVR